MARTRWVGLLILGGIALSACQTSESRQQELAAICADPTSRTPQSSYFAECQSLYPLTNQQRQRNYLAGAPAGR